MRHARSYEYDSRPSEWTNENSKPNNNSDPEYYSRQWNDSQQGYSNPGADYDGGWDSRYSTGYSGGQDNRNGWHVKDSITGSPKKSNWNINDTFSESPKKSNWNVNDTFSQSGAQTTGDSQNYGGKWNVNDTFSRSGVGHTDDTKTFQSDNYSQSDMNDTNGKWNVNDTFSRGGPSGSTMNDRSGLDTGTQTQTSAGESYDDSTLPTEWEARDREV